jgi:ankyrin repeat protein
MKYIKNIIFAGLLLSVHLAFPAYTIDNLNKAIIGGNSVEVINILDSGIDVNAPDEAGETPLYCAVKGYLQLQPFSTPKTLPDLSEYITVMQAEKYIAIIRSLLDHGANPYKENRSGVSVIKMALNIQNKEIVAWLKDPSCQSKIEISYSSAK